MKKTVEGRALEIAAHIMQEGGICRHSSALKCGRLNVTPSVCEKCLRSWLIGKAKKEMGEVKRDA